MTGLLSSRDTIHVGHSCYCISGGCQMENLTWIEIVYWASVIIGGLLFLFRLVAFFFGGGDLDAGFEGDIDLSPGDTDASFNLLSLQSLSAFFLMFGLTGLALVSADYGTIWTILGGVIAGIFTIWVVSIIFSSMKRLQADGTIVINNAIGKEGTVYLSIPAKGRGKVSVSVQGSLKIFDAISVNNIEIKTGEMVKVVDVTGDQTLVVE